MSSLFALGYHQNIVGAHPIPGFLKELRQVTFACSYSADKNVSVFLGRPPRINLEVCQFQSLALDRDYSFEWQPDTPLNLMADTRWTTICAALKEEALKISRVAAPLEKSNKARSVDSEQRASFASADLFQRSFRQGRDTVVDTTRPFSSKWSDKGVRLLSKATRYDAERETQLSSRHLPYPPCRGATSYRPRP